MAKTIVVCAFLLSAFSVETGCVQSCDGDDVWTPPPEEPTCGPFDLEPALDPAAVVSLAAGSSHVCAVLDTNAIRCWGQGGSGSLGYGNSDNIGDDETPASAGDVPVGGRIIDVAAGRGHTCALLAGGTVRCWGRATDGQLGTGSRAQIGHCPTPASTGHVALGGEVVQLSAGGRHTCALLADGTVRCWGDGQYGQLGLGSTEGVGDDEPVLAVEPVDLGEPAVQIACGYQHSCALLESGAVRCWGRGDGGQLGLGDCVFDEQNPVACHIGDDETPGSVAPVDVGGTVVQIVAGGGEAPDALGHTCALLDTGAVRCWGHAAWGQLGRGNVDIIGDDETPGAVGDIPLGGQAVDLAAGNGRTCAIMDTGGLRCWGFTWLTNDTRAPEYKIGDDETPADHGDIDLPEPVAQVVLGGPMCVRLISGDVHCWGYGGLGALGYGSTDNVYGPTQAGPVPVL